MRALWNGTDSQFLGTVQSFFKKRSGKEMVVLEDDRGLLHVYPVSDRLIMYEDEEVERDETGW